VSSNTPVAFTRDLFSRIPFRTMLQNGTSAAAKGYQNGSAAVAKGYRSSSDAVAKGYQNGTAVLAKEPVKKRIPAAALAIAAVGVAVAPLAATSGPAGAQSAAVAKPAAITSTVQSGTAAKAPAAQAPATSGTGTTTTTTTTTQSESNATTASDPYASATMSQISPTSEQGSQTHIDATSTQWVNATKIVHAAESMNLPPYASTVAVATALQESKLKNLDVAVDHDSLGLFQQRPSTGWGSPSELTDPTYAAKAFLKSLPSNYQSVALHTAAQNVQRSFNGWLYAQWQDQAKHMVYTIMHSS
jgi:hypothetical protein